MAYFSATGNTEGVAQQLAGLLSADLYAITPAEPYTEEDLDYTNPNSRSQVEGSDPDARPALAGEALDLSGYDTIFLGYPIWNGQAPKLLSTFLETYDCTGKTIVPFCTSGSSPIGSSAEALQALAPGAHWLAGQRFAADASRWIWVVRMVIRWDAAGGADRGYGAISCSRSGFTRQARRDSVRRFRSMSERAHPIASATTQ